jgi:hypothetical protein
VYGSLFFYYTREPKTLPKVIVSEKNDWSMFSCTQTEREWDKDREQFLDRLDRHAGWHVEGLNASGYFSMTGMPIRSR